MKVIRVLQEKGVDYLSNNYNIKVFKFDISKDKYLLNLQYEQFESDRFCPITNECRMLILDNNFNVVSRGFDRFFNYGEDHETTKFIDNNKLDYYEKEDGTMIKIYHHLGNWYCATKSNAFANTRLNSKTKRTFKDKVYEILNVKTQEEFNNFFKDQNINYTYIFELCSLENKVVVEYKEPKLVHLATRSNLPPYEYIQEDPFVNIDCIKKPICFKNINISELKFRDEIMEGYVAYTTDTHVPIAKIKTKEYITVHTVGSNGISSRALMRIVMLGEQSEFLAYFPEREQIVNDYTKQLENFFKEINETYNQIKDIKDVVEFVNETKKYYYGAILLKAHKAKRSLEDQFLNHTLFKLKFDLLAKFMDITFNENEMF